MERNSYWNYDNLPAPFWRFYFNETLGAYIIYNNRSIKLLPQNYYLIPPDTRILSRSEGKITQFYIHFRVTSPLERAQFGVYEFAVSEEMYMRIQQLVEWFDKNRKEELDTTFSIEAMILILQALQNFPREKLSGYCNDSRLMAVDAYMDTHLMDKLSNEALSHIAHMNKNTLMRRFREFSGLTPQMYLQRKRIEQACVWLQFTDLTIDEIATRTGFCDRHYFSRVFRQWRKLGPAAYRKRI
jgi:AraC-like DNA-binding protein